MSRTISSTGVGGPPPQIPETTASETKAAENSTQKSSATASTPTPPPQEQSTTYQPTAKLGEFKLAGSMQQAHLSSLLDSSKILKQGMEGPGAAKLQDFLIQQGYMTKDQKATAPGVFGPKTEAALKAFQKDHGLKDDGIVGPKTREAMAGGAAAKPVKTEVKQTTAASSDHPAKGLGGTKEVPDSQLPTSRSLEEQAKLYDKYSNLIPEKKLKDGVNEMNIVGVRHHNVESGKDLKSYDDRFVVLYKDEAGNKRVRVYEGATHPGQKEVKGDHRQDGTTRAKFTDVTGDGRSDVAHVKPGTYDFHLSKNKKHGEHLRPDRNVSVYRDTNQDGKITGDELADKKYSSGSILFHSSDQKSPVSVGCQTMTPGEFDNFIELVKKDPNDKVSYTLVDATK